MQLNYNETDFKQATFKEINDLMEIHLEMNKTSEEEKTEYKKEYVNVSQFSFL